MVRKVKLKSSDITERKNAERLIAEADEFKQSILDASPIGIMAYKASGQCVMANEAAAKIAGSTVDKLLAQNFHQVESWKRSGMLEAANKALEKNEDASLEMYTTSTFGKKIWLDIRFTTFMAFREKHLLAFIIDITERKMAEESLRTSEERLRRAEYAAKSGNWELHLDSQKIIASHGAAKLYGVDKDNFDYEEIKKIPLPEYRPLLDAALNKLIHNSEPYDVEFKIKAADTGEIRDIHSIATFDKDKRILFGIIQDISERKRVEDALRESQARFQAFFEQSNDGETVADMEGHYVMVNKSFCRMTGYTQEELLNMRVQDLLPLKVELKLFKQVSLQKKAGRRETELQRKDGSRFFASVSGSVLQVGANQFVHGIVRDITERKQAEEALRENQARLDLALQSAHMGVWRWEINENRRYFDDLTYQLLGINPEKFAGTAEEFFNAIHPDDRVKVKSAIARTLEQDALYEPEYRVVWPDGSIRHIRTRGKLVRDDKGQPVKINGLLWDITEQRLFEDEHLKTEKLESIGTLAGGIAHDFNNLLQGVFGYISLAKLSVDQRDRSIAALEQAEKALHQSVNLTSQLLTFSKGGKPLKKVINLKPVIEDAVKFALSGSRTGYGLSMAEDLQHVEVDAGQIGQVIQNLVLNADQAMALGGRIEMSARNVSADSVPNLPSGLQSELVEITVRDQGLGIPPEHLTKIFDPYFTTKEKGSGLGLATSYSIIRNHGGAITVTSELGKGTLFTIYLPASSEAGEPVVATKACHMAQHCRILVMDDDAVVRDVARALLTELGHKVETAKHGESAIDKYRSAKGAGKPFDVVILDLTIRGGMGGMETLEKLREIDPAAKAIVSSGYSEDSAVSTYRDKGFSAFLSKPYTVEGLRSVLSELMG